MLPEGGDCGGVTTAARVEKENALFEEERIIFLPTLPPANRPNWLYDTTFLVSQTNCF